MVPLHCLSVVQPARLARKSPGWTGMSPMAWQVCFATYLWESPQPGLGCSSDLPHVIRPARHARKAQAGVWCLA
jgi:hypothetical protein